VVFLVEGKSIKHHAEIAARLDQRAHAALRVTTSALAPVPAAGTARAGERIAAIDVGSNSIRLVVAEYEPGSGLTIIDEVKEQPGWRPVWPPPAGWTTRRSNALSRPCAGCAKSASAAASAG
jgi:hypothetical protein